MTLAEAILQAESWFQVHHEVGCPEWYYDSNNQRVSDNTSVDMSRAPCGQTYVTLTSGGLKDGAEPIPVWFADEERAASWWLFSVEDYAETLLPKDQWDKLHLYWRDQPEWRSVEFVAVDQAKLLREGNPLAPDMMHAALGVVWSRLLITKMNPEGVEEE